VQPWLAVVAITMMPIKRSTMNARWGRRLGKRILNIHSISGLQTGACRSFPKRVGSISQVERGSTVPNPVGNLHLS
jgi:hypothetical protein